MYIIENKKISIPVERKEQATYADLLNICLNTPPNEGFTLDEMSIRLRIKKILESAKEEIKIETSDFQKLKSLTLSFKWASFHEDLVNFLTYIKELEEEK